MNMRQLPPKREPKEIHFEERKDREERRGRMVGQIASLMPRSRNVIPVCVIVSFITAIAMTSGVPIQDFIVGFVLIACAIGAFVTVVMLLMSIPESEYQKSVRENKRRRRRRHDYRRPRR